MSATDLKQIKDYWNNKYPQVQVILWSDAEQDKYFGKMMAHNRNLDIEACTVGELINKGEFFLRKVTQ
jgi:hypothetical protein